MTYTPEEVMALVESVIDKSKDNQDWERDEEYYQGWEACRTAFLENVKRELGLPQ